AQRRRTPAAANGAASGDAARLAPRRASNANIANALSVAAERSRGAIRVSDAGRAVADRRIAKQSERCARVVGHALLVARAVRALLIHRTIDVADALDAATRPGVACVASLPHGRADERVDASRVRRTDIVDANRPRRPGIDGARVDRTSIAN